MAELSYKISKWHDVTPNNNSGGYVSPYRIVKEHANEEGWTEEVGKILINKNSPKEVIIELCCNTNTMGYARDLFDYFRKNVSGKSKYLWENKYDWNSYVSIFLLTKKDKARDNLKRRHRIGKDYGRRFPCPTVVQHLDLYIYSNKDIGAPGAIVKIMGKVDLNHRSVAKAEFDMENRIVYDIVSGKRDVINIINTDAVFDWIEKNIA